MLRTASSLIAAMALAGCGTTPNLEVICGARDDCHSSIAMIVFTGEDAPGRCTGSLVANDIMVTAAHCLPGSLRRLGPAADGWAVFPETDAYEARWHRISDVTTVSGTGKDVLAEDRAVIRLSEASTRPTLTVLDRALERGDPVHVPLITPDPIVYGNVQRLRTLTCRAADAAPAIDALGERAQDVGWLDDCPIMPGNSGAPVLDAQGRVRALVHGGGHPTTGIAITSSPPSFDGID